MRSGSPGTPPDKKKDSYLTLLSQLKIALSSNGYELAARYVMADFEDNIRNSVIKIIHIPSNFF